MAWPDLRDTLTGIPWAVAGAVATRMYMPERATQDLDIVVPRTAAAAVRERLDAARFALIGELTIGGSTWQAPQGTTVDVIEGSQSWLDEALALAATNHDPQGFPVLPLPYLVLMKLESGRTLDIGDVTRMLGGASDIDLADVRAVVQRYAADLGEDLESLIALGQLETRGEADR